MGSFDDLTPAQRQQIREAHATRKVTAADYASRTDRGECRVCGGDYQLAKRGLVRRHVHPTTRLFCAGGGQKPTEG